MGNSRPLVSFPQILCFTICREMCGSWFRTATLRATVERRWTGLLRLTRYHVTVSSAAAVGTPIQTVCVLPSAAKR